MKRLLWLLLFCPSFLNWLGYQRSSSQVFAFLGAWPGNRQQLSKLVGWKPKNLVLLFKTRSFRFLEQQQQRMEGGALKEARISGARQPSNSLEIAENIRKPQDQPKAGATAGTEAHQQVGTTEPTHLIVLVHGLAGTPEDLNYLKGALERGAAARGQRVLVHLARCNHRRTRDGVRAGGRRLAQEVRAVVARHPSLAELSLVGNSLGGLYVRHALALLRDADEEEGGGGGGGRGGGGEGGGGGGGGGEGGGGGGEGGGGGGGGGGGTLAGGLRARSLTTVASPHLGVRRFTYLALPDFLHPLAGTFVGRTGEDLFLRDAAAAAAAAARPPLLLEMATSPAYLEPLALFQRRRAYANVQGDFMVPFGTASFAPDPAAFAAAASAPTTQEGPGAAAAAAAAAPVASVGGRAFSGFRRFGHFAPFGRGNKEKVVWEYRTASASKYGRNADGAGRFSKEIVKERANFWDQQHDPSTSSIERGGKTIEETMAKSLDSVGWSKVGVDFGGIIPFSHNMICALSRNPITEKVFEAGKPVMDHAAQYILSEDM